MILKPFHFEVLVARIERRIAARAHVPAACATTMPRSTRVVERAIQIGELREQLQGEPVLGHAL